MDVKKINGYDVKDATAREEIQELFTTKVQTYENINVMKSDTNLQEGMYIKTRGFYEENDGGHAEYIIIDDDEIIVDDASIHQLSNGLKAMLLIHNNTINFKQLGAQASTSENPIDCKIFFEKYVSICNRDNTTYKLYIPGGEWFFSPTHVCRIGGVNIKGDSGFPARNYMGTVIKPIEDNQDYIWKFGGVDDMNNDQLSYDATNTSNIIKGLTFSSDTNKLNYGALVLEYSNYGNYEDLYFNNLIGTGIYIRSCWENYFNRINFRKIYDFSKPCWLFDTARSINGVSANISSSSFDKLMFENCCGNLIQVNISANFLNNQFGEINVEQSYHALLDGETENNVTQETDLSQMIPLYVFYGVGFANTFNTINYTGATAREKYYHAINDLDYYFQGIFGVPSSEGTTEGNIFNNIINNIFLRRDVTILTTDQLFYNAFRFTVANIVASAKITKKFEINNGATLIDVINFSDRNTAVTSDNGHKKILNGIELYKHGNAGSIYNENDSINDLGLVLKKPSNSTVILNKLTYPFDHSNTAKQLYKLRCKGSGSFTVRGLVNNENSNKVYTLANTGDWENITIEMNYDSFSPITIISSSENIIFDTLSYVGEESIEENV